MSTKILSFAASGPGLRVDLDRLIRSRMLLQANSGGGKSHALRQLLEETHGRVPHLVIDPEGEFASLRERFDYVLASAGAGGDVAATPKTAGLLCRRMVELGASAVLDIYDLSHADRREFVRRFLTELMSLPRTLWRPLLVVLDEAHVFVPEKGHGESAAAESVIQLCSQGRKRGFCAVLATQRISKLHKDAAAELNNKLIGRTGLDVDMKRAGDELGLDKDARLQLKALAPGEFFVFGPAISMSVERVRTGAVKTSHPEAGGISNTPPAAPAKVRAMLAQLADLPQQAETRERTMETLEREVRTLKAELAKKPTPAPAQPVEVKILDAVQVDRLHRIAEDLVAQLSEIRATIAKASSSPPTKMRAPAYGGAPVPRTNPTRSPAITGGQEPSSDLPQGERKMLEALALRHPTPLSRDQLGILSGYASSGGTFRTYLPALKRKGLVEERGDLVQLTAGGVELARGAIQAAPQTPEDVREMWRRVLGAGERRMFDVLCRFYPDSISRGALGAESGYAAGGGTFRTYLPKLKRLGLATEEGDQVRAADALFQ